MTLAPARNLLALAALAVALLATGGSASACSMPEGRSTCEAPCGCCASAEKPEPSTAPAPGSSIVAVGPGAPSVAPCCCRPGEPAERPAPGHRLAPTGPDRAPAGAFADALEAEGFRPASTPRPPDLGPPIRSAPTYLLDRRLLI